MAVATYIICNYMQQPLLFIGRRPIIFYPKEELCIGVLYMRLVYNSDFAVYI